MTEPGTDVAVVATVYDLVPADIGRTVEISSLLGPVQGELTDLVRSGDDTKVTVYVRQKGTAFNTAFLSDETSPRACRLIETSPPPVTPIDLDLLKELASISDRLKALPGEEKDLKARRKELSEMLVEQFAENDVRTINVNGRTAYVHTTTSPKFLERPAGEGGGKYASEDALAAFREIGRDSQITPATVNWMTLGSVLREYRDDNEPLPTPLAKIVTLDENLEIRVRAPRSK